MSSIRKSLSSGVFYIALARYSGIFISIIIGAVLARLLTPAEFGIVALITVFVSFFNILSDFGLGPAVVQNHSLSNKDVQSIFSFSILLGFVLAGLFFLIAPLVSGFYDEPELINISRLLSLSVLFNSLQIIPRARLQKALKFKKLGLISVSVQLLSGAIAIAMAFAGYSYYALVIQSILAGGISLVVLYLFEPVKISRKFDIDAIRKIIKFSSFQFLFNFINYFSRNADNILIGKFLSPTALGYYDKSYRLMMMPVANLTHVITPVLMPVLSKHQNDKELIYSVYVKVVKILATIGFPLSVFLYFSAGEIIHILYGPQWESSIPVFKILGLSVGIQMVLSSSGSIFQAVNRTDLLFYSGILGAMFMIGGISYGIFIGKSLEAVGYGLIVAFSINFFQGYFMLIHIALKKSFPRFLKTLQFPILISMGIAAALWAYSLFCADDVFINIVAKTAIAGLIFSAIFMTKTENRNTIKRKFKRKA